MKKIIFVYNGPGHGHFIIISVAAVIDIVLQHFRFCCHSL